MVAFLIQSSQVTHMPGHEPLAQPPVSGGYQAASAVALDPDFDLRWAAWVARGQVHEQLVRRKLLMLGGVLAIAGGIVYTFIR